jgi:hypothetical protein
MADPDDNAPAGETPMQKALRLKKAAQAKAGPRGGRLEHETVAAARSQSKSKPWMKK